MHLLETLTIFSTITRIYKSSGRHVHTRLSSWIGKNDKEDLILPLRLYQTQRWVSVSQYSLVWRTKFLDIIFTSMEATWTEGVFLILNHSVCVMAFLTIFSKLTNFLPSHEKNIFSLGKSPNIFPGNVFSSYRCTQPLSLCLPPPTSPPPTPPPQLAQPLMLIQAHLH